MFENKGQSAVILLIVVFILSILLAGGLGDPTTPRVKNVLITPAPGTNDGSGAINPGINGTGLNPVNGGTGQNGSGQGGVNGSRNSGNNIDYPTQYPVRLYKHFWDQPQGTYTNPTLTSPDASKKSLQLTNLNFSPLPTPVQLIPDPLQPSECNAPKALSLGKDQIGNCCVEDGRETSTTKCCPGVPTCQDIQKAPKGEINGKYYGCDGIPDAQTWCDAKPVIYLYPLTTTNVSVMLTVPGRITQSIPFYPQDGWKNISARPDGTFSYLGNSYSKLFYEASVIPIDPPKKGFVVSINNSLEKLSDIAIELGFTRPERQELVAYWVPKLKELQAPYIFISVFDQQSKDLIDHVHITPKPDTFIQHIFYFKPLFKFEHFPPLSFPAPPQRKGFTAVEWGGIVD